MAVFLTKNSPGLRTSPVKRGYWVVRRLLGEKIPPPPPNVPELPKRRGQARRADPAAGAGPAPRRQELRRLPRAVRRDRPGLRGLRARRRAPDASTSAAGPSTPARPSPTAARGPASTACAPTSPSAAADEFVDNLCRKLLAYALGRSLLPSDDETIDGMRTRLAADGDRFGSLVESIVTSPQFLNKRVDSDTGGGMKTMSGSEQETDQSRPSIAGVPAHVPPRRRRHDGPALARVAPGLGLPPRWPAACPRLARSGSPPCSWATASTRTNWWAKGSGADDGAEPEPASRWPRSKAKLNVISGLFNKHATGVGIHPGPDRQHPLGGRACRRGPC